MTTAEEIKDGRIPANAWFSDDGSRWFGHPEPHATEHIEVLGRGYASIRLLTKSKSDPSKTYIQDFINVNRLILGKNTPTRRLEYEG
jgi:serine kinase of HPr protein (carbohydrate metabolism regulator)